MIVEDVSKNWIELYSRVKSKYHGDNLLKAEPPNIQEQLLAKARDTYTRHII